MRVLLVNPPIPQSYYNREFYLPSGLLYLGAVLRDQGHHVHLLDMKTLRPAPGQDLDTLARQTLHDALLAFDPEVIGFGCLFSGNFAQVLQFAGQCKRWRPEVPTVAGGIHVTIHARAILENCPELDFLCLGEAEESLVQLLNALKYQRPVAAIDGLAFRSEGRVCINPKQNYIEDVDRLPFPAYELVDLAHYAVDTSAWHNPKGLSFQTSIPIVSSRSCPQRCSFCSMHMTMGPRWRARSATQVVDEIATMVHSYGQNHFSFMDDNFTLDRRRTLEICRQIVDRRLDIQFETPNGLSVKTLDAEVLDALVAAGLIRVSLAIESGSEDLRNRVMHKRLSDEKIYEVVDLTKRYPQLVVKAFFILGMPEETHETLEATWRMIQRIDVDRVYLQNLIPYPGTPLFEQVRRDGLLIDVDPETLYRDSGMFMANWDRFFVKPYALDLDELRAFRQRCEPYLRERRRRPEPPAAIEAVRTGPARRSSSPTQEIDR